ncbi:hypothetical protein [Oceanicoccus sp. KOV_DT_Chl]|uniref:hypothetical protein n=1 Tax=Oceanicoccus sp. KOV_DT_Chl TaxID=1904639 RepID=UPI000C7DB2E8|nr:hypothetical protein [Oceanicoccus sp. KOV_DT_Chl]
MKTLETTRSIRARLLAISLTLCAIAAPASADYFTYNIGGDDVTLSEGYIFNWDTKISDSILTIDVTGINEGEEELPFNEDWEIEVNSPGSEISVDQGIGYHNDDGWSIEVKQRELDYDLYRGNNEFTITSLSLSEESIFVSYYFVDDSSAENDEVYGSLCMGEACGSGPSPVPVPAALWLFGSALTLLVGVKRKK